MSDIRTITPESTEWPHGFNDMWPADRPQQLWVRGDNCLGCLTKRSVAIVGSRACTSYGQHVATDLAYGLAGKGWTVVSGGAFGIDIAAHRGALVAGDGSAPTVVVLACGVDTAYPSAHADVFDQIVRSGGLIVSAYAPGDAPYRSRFLERNQLIAAMSQGTVLVEAAKRSGSINAFEHARKLGRKLMVVPGPVTSAQSAGTADQLRERDTYVVVEHQDVVDVLEVK